MHTVDQNVTKGKEDKARRQARKRNAAKPNGTLHFQKTGWALNMFSPSRHPPLCMASAELLMPLLTGGPCGPPHC